MIGPSKRRASGGYTLLAPSYVVAPHARATPNRQRTGTGTGGHKSFFCTDFFDKGPPYLAECVGVTPTLFATGNRIRRSLSLLHLLNPFACATRRNALS